LVAFFRSKLFLGGVAPKRRETRDGAGDKAKGGRNKLKKQKEPGPERAVPPIGCLGTQRDRCYDYVAAKRFPVRLAGEWPRGSTFCGIKGGPCRTEGLSGDNCRRGGLVSFRGGEKVFFFWPRSWGRRPPLLHDLRAVLCKNRTASRAFHKGGQVRPAGGPPSINFSRFGRTRRGQPPTLEAAFRPQHPFQSGCAFAVSAGCWGGLAFFS